MLSSSQARGFKSPWVCTLCRSYSTTSTPHVRVARVTRNLPTKPARTRFAPSPTGSLHLGSLRTALFNYLVAKGSGGKFILRIEDTDKRRTVPGAEERLYQDLKWAGLDWDEGPDIGGPLGPYRQSQRTAIYQTHAKTLLDNGHAYQCFCSAERLNDLARQRSELKLPAGYDRTCYKIPKTRRERRALQGLPHVIRLRVPLQSLEYIDSVYGNIAGASKERKRELALQNIYEDPILIKSDGQPTYHFANVIDDHHMQITHVIRATEWMSSTPWHCWIYKCFGWTRPSFAHVGLLQNDNREKFSKRNSDLDLRSFEQIGIFPEALLNHVALFGWSHKLPSDFFRLPDLIKNFSMKFTTGNTIVAPEKLIYLQKKFAIKYVEENGKELGLMVERVSKIARDKLMTQPGGLNFTDSELKHRITALICADASRYTTPQEFFDRHVYFFRPISPVPYVSGKNLSRMDLAIDDVESIHHHFDQVPLAKWTQAELRDESTNIIVYLTKMKYPGLDLNQDPTAMKKISGAVNHYLRWAVTGGLPGLGIALTMELLGREVTMQRLEEAKVQFIAAQSQEKSLEEGSQVMSGIVA